MSAEKYVDENGQEITVLQNETDEFEDFYTKNHYAIDYSEILPGEPCPYSKDELAKFLGLSRDINSQEKESCLSYLYKQRAKKGPITSWTYDNCINITSPVYFEIDVLDGYINNPKFHLYNHEYSVIISPKIEFENNGTLLSRPIEFGMAYKLDHSKRAIVVSSDDLLSLDIYDQYRWIKYKITNQEEYGSNSSFVNKIIGKEDNKYSVFLAVLEEISIINNICLKAGLNKMFSEEFWDQYKNLKGYNIVFLPTKYNLMIFSMAIHKIIVQTFDKLVFYQKANRILPIGEQEKVDIKSIIRTWLTKNYMIPEEEIPKLINMEKSISEIIQLRNAYAHDIITDEWNEEIWDKQYNIIMNIYKGLNLIRKGMFFKFHPDIEIPQRIDEEENIVMY